MTKHILLIQDDAASARRIRETLGSARSAPFEVEWLRSGADAVHRLLRPDESSFRAMLVDLDLPDGRGLDIVEKLYRVSPRVPIIVLAAGAHEAVAKQSLHCGAQEYLLKARIDAYWLPKMLDNVVRRATSVAQKVVEQKRARVMLNMIGDGVIYTDAHGHVLELNHVAELMTGWSRGEAVGHAFDSVFRVLDAERRSPLPDPVMTAIRENRRVDLTEECILVRRDGRESTINDAAAPIPDLSGGVAGAVVVFHDAGDARAMSMRTSHLAQYDHLTGLPNRMLLNDRLSRAIEVARRHREQLALLFVDVDRFKRINDSLGHAVGDELLKSVAGRLEGCVRKSDTVGRLGGDEFVVLLSEIRHPDDAALIADKILVALNAPHATGEHDLHVTVSMGIGVYPRDGTDAETLMQNADIAMFHAKESGRNSHQFFQPDMNVRAVERQSVETDLRRAIEDDELELVYQPQINLVSDTIDGVEALIRWRHPTRGLIAPAEFISVAEECGLIVPIGRWVLREACRQVREWLDAGLEPTPVAINVSAVELRSKNFAKDVETALRSAGLAPGLLGLELTETGLMENFKSVDAVLGAVKELGVPIALDDFGTGYSSLSYLKRFPVDAIKIDKSFVHDMSTDADDTAIVNAVIAMGHSLRRRVIAEGVETSEQLTLLRAQGCEHAQGYYFSRPVAATAFTKHLRMASSC